VNFIPFFLTSLKEILQNVDIICISANVQFSSGPPTKNASMAGGLENPEVRKSFMVFAFFQ